MFETQVLLHFFILCIVQETKTGGSKVNSPPPGRTEDIRDVAAESAVNKSSSRASSSAQAQPPSVQPQQQQQTAPTAASQLPPRLQRKQQQVEEEKFLKYYKPMEFMRQSNFNHGASDGGAPGASGSSGVGVSKTTSAPRPGNASNSRAVHDIHSRGTVKNKKLWTDSEPGKQPDKHRGGRETDAEATAVSGDFPRLNQDHQSAAGKNRDADRSSRVHGERSVTWADGEGQSSGRVNRLGGSDLDDSMASMSLQSSSSSVRSSDGAGSSKQNNSAARNSGVGQVRECVQLLWLILPVLVLVCLFSQQFELSVHNLPVYILY